MTNKLKTLITVIGGLFLLAIFGTTCIVIEHILRKVGLLKVWVK